MAKERGSWKIEYTVEPDLDDLGHVSELILQGYTEGELVESEEEEDIPTPFGVHKAHCFLPDFDLGEGMFGCKYGDDKDCPMFKAVTTPENEQSREEC